MTRVTQLEQHQRTVRMRAVKQEEVESYHDAESNEDGAENE